MEQVRDKLAELKALTEMGYIDALEGFMKKVCAPVYLSSTDGRLSQASITIVTGSGGFLGLTAKHVADAIEAPGLSVCQVGVGPLRPRTPVQRSTAMDLAAFRLSDDDVCRSGHLAFTVRSWPLPSLEVGDYVIAGGWPGMYRVESPGRYDVAFTWFFGRIGNVSDKNLGFSLNIAESLCAGEERIPAHADLGGCSGGPLFRLTETPDAGGIHAGFELVGLIYEYSAEWELLLANPLTGLTSNGHFEA